MPRLRQKNSESTKAGMKYSFYERIISLGVSLKIGCVVMRLRLFRSSFIFFNKDQIFRQKNIPIICMQDKKKADSLLIFQKPSFV